MLLSMWRITIASLFMLLSAACDQPVMKTLHVPIVDENKGDSLPDPIETVDVAIIGSGPAGLSAAWSAREAGASVRILEMSDFAGGAGYYAGNFFAVETDTQTKAGTTDSVADALADWTTCTGGDGADERVIAFVEGSSTTLSWLVDEFGAEVSGLSADDTTCDVPRVHSIRVTDSYVVSEMALTLTEETRLQTRADELLVDATGAVRGVWITELSTGEDGWISAGATVVASGGFARNLERLLADRPDLTELDPVVETVSTATGLGHDMLEAVGAGSHNTGSYGVYMHATHDYREGYEGEALIFTGVRHALIVNGEGERVANEEDTSGFGMFDLVVASPSHRLLALWPQDVFAEKGVSVPGYNADSPDQPELIENSELVDEGLARIYDTIDEVAAGEDIDLDRLSATYLRYVELVAAGGDSDFGKSADLLDDFGGKPMVITDLVPGASKAFGGIRTNLEGRVLDNNSAPISGLYAAGEVTGMLGTEAVGDGFTGSVAACYWSGRMAGEAAAMKAMAP